MSCLTEDERAEVMRESVAERYSLLENLAEKHRSDLIDFTKTSLSFIQAEDEILPELKKMWPNKFFEMLQISYFFGGGMILTGPEDMKCEGLCSGVYERWHGFLFHSTTDGKFLVIANSANSQVVAKTI